MTIDLDEAANAPKRQRTAEGSVEERSIQDKILAKNNIAQDEALTAPPWGIRLARTRPGGTVN